MTGWHCEVCGLRGQAINAYFAHLRTHPVGELAATVEPGLGWPSEASYCKRLPTVDAEPGVVTRYGFRVSAHTVRYGKTESAPAHAI